MKIRFLIAMMLIGLGVNAQSTNPLSGIVKFVDNPQLATIDTTATKLIGRKASDGRIVRYNWAAIKAYMNAGGSTPTLQEVITSGSTATTANPIVMNGQGGQISLNNQGVTIISGNGVNTFYVSDTIAKLYSRAQGIPAIHNNELATLGQVNTLVNDQDLQAVLNSGSAANVNSDILIDHGTGATYSNIALEDGSAVIGTLSNNLKVTNTTAVIGSALTVGAPVSEDDAVRVQDLQGYIPLSGTISGAPVTGNIEIDLPGEEIGLVRTTVNGMSAIGIGETGVPRLSITGDEVTSIAVSSGSVVVYADDPASRGLIGVQDFTPNITDLDYTQKKYVDDAIASAGGGTVTSVTGTGGVTVANGTTTPVIGLSDITPTSLTASGTVTGSNLSGTNTGDNATNTTSNTYADGKVQNNLTASTTIAPSADAVNTGLALKANLTANTFTGTQTFAANLQPDAAGARSVGTSVMPFSAMYTAQLYATLGSLIVGTNTANDLSFRYNGTNRVRLNNTAFFPISSDLTLGASGTRWTNVYGVAGDFTSNVTTITPTLAAHAATKGYVDTALIPTYRASTTSTTLTATDYTVTLTSGTATFTLPTAVGITGKIYIVKNKGAGVLTIATTSSQTMDGATTKTFGTQYGGMAVQSNGTNWDVIGLF